MPGPEGQAGQRTVTKAPSLYSIHSQRHGSPALTGCGLSGHAGLEQREKPILTSISGPESTRLGKEAVGTSLRWLVSGKHWH